MQLFTNSWAQRPTARTKIYLIKLSLTPLSRTIEKLSNDFCVIRGCASRSVSNSLPNTSSFNARWLACSTIPSKQSALSLKFVYARFFDSSSSFSSMNLALLSLLSAFSLSHSLVFDLLYFVDSCYHFIWFFSSHFVRGSFFASQLFYSRINRFWYCLCRNICSLLANFHHNFRKAFFSVSFGYHPQFSFLNLINIVLCSWECMCSCNIRTSMIVSGVVDVKFLTYLTYLVL